MQYYDLNGTGTVSNIIFWVAQGVFLLFAGFFALMLVWSLEVIRSEKNGRRAWTSVFWILLTWIPRILLEARAASEPGVMGTVGGGQGTQAILNGNVIKRNRGVYVWLALSLLGLPLFLLAVVLTGWLEPPLRLGVSPSRIDILYRFSWRDWSIPMTEVTDVKLHRDDFFSKGVPEHGYELIIKHGGEETKLISNAGDYYKQIIWEDQQVTAACDAIHRNILAMNTQKTQRLPVAEH